MSLSNGVGAIGGDRVRRAMRSLRRRRHKLMTSRAGRLAVASVVLVAGALVASAAAASAGAATRCGDTWTNPSGGTWTTDSDWSTGAPPTVAQAACLTIGLKGPVVLSGTEAAKSLTVGGAAGSAVLELDGANLTLGANSAISTTGAVVVEGAVSNLRVSAPATLTNYGTLTVDYGGLTLTGNLTNASGGFVNLPETGGWQHGGYAPTLTLAGPGTFKNLGLVALERNSVIVVPAGGANRAAIYNAGGIIENGGNIKVEPGGTFIEGGGSVMGPAGGSYAVQIQGGALALDGTGPATFQLSGSPQISGLLARDETLLTYASSPEIARSFTNNGTIATEDGASTFTITSGHNLYNAGTIEALHGDGIAIVGNLYNEPNGAILAAGSGSSLALDGPTKLTNRGTISLWGNADFYDPARGSSGSVLYNDEGTISDEGSLHVARGGTFLENSGTETGNAVLVQDGTLELAGAGASSFDFSGGRLTGDIGAHQDVSLSGAVAVASSFTNLGTLSGKSVTFDLPEKGTLTNDGTLDSPPSSQEFVLDGSLVNGPRGVVNMNGTAAHGGSLDMQRAGTTFSNEGLLEMAHASIGLFAMGQTFDNTGTMRFGVYGGSWGSFGLHSEIEASPGDIVGLGGEIDPVFTDGTEPASPWPSTAATITYGVVLAADSDPNGIDISCGGSVGGNWAISCTTKGEGAATLTATSTTSLSPTVTTVVSSSPQVNYGQITSSYGKPVTLTATVSSQHGPAPTGTAAFYDVSGSAGGIDLLGTAPVSTSAGVSSANLTTSALAPGAHDVEVFYSGDAVSLPSMSADIAQLVTADTTTINIAPMAASYFGQRVTLEAVVTPSGTGPAEPNGEVVFLDGDQNYLGAGRLSTLGGVTTATVMTSGLYPGTDTVNASYSGDTNYSASNSSPVSAVVKRPLARRK